MSIPIQNASSIPLNLNTGTVPDVSGALRDWFQPMTFTKIVKSVLNFKLVETVTNVDFLGVVDPGSQPLKMMTNGQRKWNSFTCYTQPGVPLEPDDVVVYLGTRYRVKNKFDYTIYQYVRYELEQDFT